MYLGVFLSFASTVAEATIDWGHIALVEVVNEAGTEHGQQSQMLTSWCVRREELCGWIGEIRNGGTVMV
jgi:hypothetical protein